MAARIKASNPGTRVELIGGSKGAFIVVADGDEVWNKHKRGGFPDEDELAAEIGRR